MDDDILTLLKEKDAQASRQAQRAIILQPGAIGDCILTLPLASFMKKALGLGGIDIIGHTEYIGILPGRTCVDGICSMDSMDMHKLFTERRSFDLADGDPLINFFADYTWIVTFLGEPDSDFEQNLIFTANCSHSAEVVTLSLKPPGDFSRHVTEFYLQNFIEQSGLTLEHPAIAPDDFLIKVTEADRETGRELLKEIDVNPCRKVMFIHPGSGGRDKCWHLDNFLTVAKELRANGFEIIFLLGPAELERFSPEIIRNISQAGKCLMDLSLTDVLCLLSCADGFAGNDSGITHLAAGMGIKTLAVFGPTEPVIYRPIGPSVTTITGSTKAFARQPSRALQQKLLEAILL